MGKKHIWSLEEAILAVYLHKYKTYGLNYNTTKKYAHLIGIKKPPLRARIRQVKGIDSNDAGVRSSHADNTVMALKLVSDVDNRSAWAAFINTLWP